MSFQNLSIHFELPPATVLSFPPSFPRSFILPPNQVVSGLREPFKINTKVFDFTIDIRFPFTMAALYIAAIIFMNEVNRKRLNKPWNFSRTPVFKSLVIIHNTSLALFSGWAFYSVCHALWSSLPAWDDPNLFANAVRALCQTEISVEKQVSSYKYNIWDQGLAYVGWVFYLSKFYEIFDTMIILARGKTSSALQTYHHAGVMVCGWVAIRYKSSVALVGIFLNSFVHTLMYTYFALAAAAVPLSMRIKRAMTTIQITQFLLGFVLGYSYLFVAYDVSTPDHSTPQNSTTPASFTVIPGTQPSNLTLDRNSRIWLPELQSPQQTTVKVKLHCLQDSGKAFPILVTTIYVVPLLYMFCCFFTRSYSKRPR
ncbi:ELO family [Aspergillus pseudoustus]|uniref:Elongation of fatty acids protein n=1 Tax=Aspergillus pseudoustus TaxID=1810923 RepID=A0ABR4IW51_9EURO